MDLLIDPHVPDLTPAQALTGWHREFCLELMGEGRARVFVRLVHSASHKAAELQHGVLFHRVGAGFQGLHDGVAWAGEPLQRLVASAQRQQPCRDNLFAAVVYDRQAWEAVMEALDRWQRRPHAAARAWTAARTDAGAPLRPSLRQLPILARPACASRSAQPSLR